MGLLYRGPEWRLELAASEGSSPRGEWAPRRPGGDHQGASITCPDGSARYPPGDDIFTGQRQPSSGLAAWHESESCPSTQGPAAGRDYFQISPGFLHLLADVRTAEPGVDWS